MSTKWQAKLWGDSVIPWLLESNPWTKYRTMTDLLDLPPSSVEVVASRNELRQHPQIKSLVAEASKWFPQPVTRHNDAKICYYRLMALAELSLDTEDDGIKQLTGKATERVVNSMSAVRQLLPEIGKSINRPVSVAEEWHTLPCDSPIITYYLLLFGMDNLAVGKSVETLTTRWGIPQGWFCHFPFAEGQFKKLQAGCPMAGLIALEVFSQRPDLK